MRPFTEKQIELVTTFADQAVIAIENVRLLDEVQARTRELSEALEQQRAASEVLRVISSSPGELEPVFQVMLANATRLCEAKFGAHMLREGDYSASALYSAPAAYQELWRSARGKPHTSEIGSRSCQCPKHLIQIQTCEEDAGISRRPSIDCYRSRCRRRSHDHRRADAQGR